MELKEIDSKTYLKYALKNKYISIYQLPQWGELKETNGWKPYTVGLYDGSDLKGVTLLLEKPTQIKKSLFYSPRGYLMDMSDINLLKEFHNEVIKFIKNHKGFMLKIDPNVIYATYDSNGELIDYQEKIVLENLINLGYKHLGFVKDFENLQPRYLCRFELQDTYDKTIDTFVKSTRKHLLDIANNAIHVREIDENEIELFVSLLEETANKKDFVIRPSSYYKKMYTLMKDYIKLYITYIDTKEYLKTTKQLLEDAKKERISIEQEMQRVNVGSKLKKKESDIINKIEKLEKKYVEAEELQETGDIINIGALMSLFIGNEGITFMSGTVDKYKEFGPKYAYYNEHIKESLKQKKKYVNFYGISGNLDKNSQYYGIYEIKKGFNPEIVELIGEFDFIINKFDYHLYKLALKFYKVLKKIKK